MSGGGSEFIIRAGNNESNSIRFIGIDNPVPEGLKKKKAKPRKKKAGDRSKSNDDPVLKTCESAELKTEAVSSQESKDEVVDVTGYFKDLLSSIAQASLENYSQTSHGVKKYCGNKQDKRTPPQFLREFESSILTCLDDLTKAQYFSKVFDYDLFAYALAIPFDKGYEAARKYFLEMTWNNDIQSFELQKLAMSDGDREIFGYEEDDEETFDLYEASMIKLYIRAKDCGVTSAMVFSNFLHPELPLKFRNKIGLKDYENLETFAAALHRQFVDAKVREESEEIKDHNAFMYKFITGKSCYTGETASDSN